MNSRNLHPDTQVIHAGQHREPVTGAVMPIFRADRVAIVVDKSGKYYGLITKIDMINYLRSQLVR